MEGCQRIGDPCPSGDFGLVTGSAVLYVKPGAAGDGSLANPYGTIKEATDRASSGTTIALAKGTFHEAVQLPGGVRLQGACVEGTIVAGGIAVEGRRASVADLSVSISPDTIGVSVIGDASAVIERIEVDTSSAGVVLSQTSTLSVLSRARLANASRSAIYAATAPVSISDVEIMSSLRGFRLGGAQVSVARALIHDIELEAIATVGSLTLTDSAIVRSGFGVSGGYAVIEMDHVALRDIVPAGDPPATAILTLSSSMSLSHVAIERALAGAVNLDGISTARISDLYVMATTRGITSRGVALNVAGGSSARLSRARFEGNGDGITVASKGSVLAAEDLRLIGAPSGPDAVQVELVGGATMSLSRAFIRSFHGTPLFLDSSYSTVSDANLEIIDASSDTLGVSGGCGAAEFLSCGRFTGSRLRISGKARAVHFHDLASYGLSDIDIENASDAALFIDDQDEPVVHTAISRFRAAGTLGDAIHIATVNLAAVLEDISISGSMEAAVHLDARARLPFHDPLAVAVRRFAFDGNGIGIWIQSGTVSVSQGALTKNAVGAQVDDGAIDPASTFDRVSFAGNTSAIVVPVK
jgi:hypothetical protein